MVQTTDTKETTVGGDHEGYQSEPPGKEEQKHRFVVMRAKGYSYARIGRELGVSKGTLTAWNAKLDILQIKQTLHLDHLRCKTPAMVRRELWVTLLAYNLIRKAITTSAAVHHKKLRRLDFAFACQTILTSWMLLSTDSCRDAKALYEMMLAQIAAYEVADRPGRIEPRVLKRRRARYPLMKRPR